MEVCVADKVGMRGPYFVAEKITCHAIAIECFLCLRVRSDAWTLFCGVCGAFEESSSPGR